MKKKILSLLLTVAMLLSAASLMSGSVYATEAVVTIGSYDDLVSFINSLADNDYDGSVVTITADIKVNEGWNAKDGTCSCSNRGIDSRHSTKSSQVRTAGPKGVKVSEGLPPRGSPYDTFTPVVGTRFRTPKKPRKNSSINCDLWNGDGNISGVGSDHAFTAGGALGNRDIPCVCVGVDDHRLC